MLEGFLEEEGDVLAGCDLDRGEGGGGLFGEGFDRVFGLGGHVVDQGAEESPFFEGGGYRLRLVGCGDGVAIAGYDLEEEIHVFEDFIVGGATVEGAGAKSVDGGCFAGGGGRMGDCAFEGSGGGFVNQVRGGGHEGHCECYGKKVSFVGNKREKDEGTFHSEYRLLFRLLLLDAFEESNHELSFLPTDLFLNILRGQDVYVGLVALFSSLHGAALPSEYFLYTVCELRPPCIARVFCTVTIENFVNRANTVPFISIHSSTPAGARSLVRKQWTEREVYLNDVSSLNSSSSSEPPLLLFPLTLLAAREVAGELGLELAGEEIFERALREVVLPLSKACRRRSCILRGQWGSCGYAFVAKMCMMAERLLQNASSLYAI